MISRKKLPLSSFFAISTILFRDLTFKMFMRNWPNFSNFWNRKIETLIKTFAKTFAYIKNEYENEKFLRYPFAYLWNKKWNYFSYFNHNFNTSPSTDGVFEMIKIPRNGCKDTVPKVIIPIAKISNTKITNAIIPNVTYNGSPN